MLLYLESLNPVKRVYITESQLALLVESSMSLNDENDTTIANMDMGKLKHYDINQGPMPNHSLHENIDCEGIAHDKTYISYGFSNFDKSKFQPIQNRGFLSLKPINGFWASPLDSKWGWFEFIERECPTRKNTLDTNVQFTINPNANIYVIDNADDVQNLEKYFFLTKYDLAIDWVAMSNDYDGVFLTDKGAVTLHDYFQVTWNGSKYYITFDIWDVESLCIFNPDIIENVKSNQDDGKRERRANIKDDDDWLWDDKD